MPGDPGLEIPALRETSTPGVYLNRANVLVDRNGVALEFKEVLKRDRAALSEVLDHEVTTPAQFLKSVALDPRKPFGLRVDAAKSAAPYFDRRMPQAIDGGVDPNTGVAVPLFDPSKLQALPTKELQALMALLEKAGAAK